MGWTLAEHDIRKVTVMRLSGEDQIYKQEYETCLKRIQARQRVRARREQARRRFLSTKQKV